MSGRGSSAPASGGGEDAAAAGSTGQTDAVTTGEDGGQVGDDQTVEVDALDLLYGDTLFGPSTSQIATAAWAQTASKLGIDPFPGVMSLDEAAAYNATVQSTMVGSGADDYVARAGGYALSHEELNWWRGMYDDAVKQHGSPFDNSPDVEAAFQRNEDILAKADLDWAQQGKDFAYLGLP